MNLRREVTSLAPARTPAQRASAAKALLKMLEDDQIRPIDVILADAIPPLLHMAQTPKRTPENLQPDPATPRDVIEMSDAALLLLGFLTSAGVQTLSEAGWHVDDDGTGRGRPIYVNPSTTESRDTPPDLLEYMESLGLSSEERWALDLLFELSTLTTPFVSALSNSNAKLVWPARIRHHEPENPPGGLDGHVSGLAVRKQAVTIVDVINDDEDDEEDEDGRPISLLASSRHLVLGPWQGVAGFRETEVDLEAPPGTHLESWYTCALAACAVLATGTGDRAGRGKVLVLGLGGGAVPMFLGLHFPGIAVDAVESERSVAKLAERWFGLKCEPSFLDADEGVFPEWLSKKETTVGGTASESADGNKDTTATEEEQEGDIVIAGDMDEAMDTPNFRHITHKTHEIRPTRVRVTTAETFCAATATDPETRFDAVLLDVYTRGAFPVPLLTPTFFTQLAKLLKPKGCLAVNAGVGGDRDAVERLVRDVLPNVQVLMDGNKGRLEGEYENAVVVGQWVTPLDDGQRLVTLDNWNTRCKDIQENWPDAPRIPFALRSVVLGEDGELMIYWGGNEEVEQPEPSAKAKPPPVLIDRNDPAFALFD